MAISPLSYVGICDQVNTAISGTIDTPSNVQRSSGKVQVIFSGSTTSLTAHATLLNGYLLLATYLQPPQRRQPLAQNPNQHQRDRTQHK